MKEMPMMARVGAAIATSIYAMTDEEFNDLILELANDRPKSKFSMVVESIISELGMKR